jgi:hypothetical protein
MRRSSVCAALAAALVIALLSPPAPATEAQGKGRKAGKASSGPRRKAATKWSPSGPKTVARAPAGPQRIEFGPGTMSASMIGQVTKGQCRTYLLDGRAGTSVTLRVQGPDGTRPWFSVAAPAAATLPPPQSVKGYDGGELPYTATWALETDGVYAITVTELDGRVCMFTLTVDVR